MRMRGPAGSRGQLHPITRYTQSAAWGGQVSQRRVHMETRGCGVELEGRGWRTLKCVCLCACACACVRVRVLAVLRSYVHIHVDVHVHACVCIYGLEEADGVAKSVATLHKYSCSQYSCRFGVKTGLPDGRPPFSTPVTLGRPGGRLRAGAEPVAVVATMDGSGAAAGGGWRW